jgi:outer membrane protein assembly factor BamE (lipoprotein component of BamABCDE complex)
MMRTFAKKMIACAVFLALFSGCLYIPTSDHKVTGNSILEGSISLLKPGAITREEVLVRFGEPTARSESGRFYFYAWEATKAYFAYAIGGGYSAAVGAGPIRADRMLVLEFGADDLLIRVDRLNVGAFTERREAMEAWLKRHAQRDESGIIEATGEFRGRVRTITPVPEDVRADLGKIGLVVSLDDDFLPDSRLGMTGEPIPDINMQGEDLVPDAAAKATVPILRPVWPKLRQSDLMTTRFLEAAKSFADKVQVKPLTEEDAANPDALKALEIDTILKLIISECQLKQNWEEEQLASLRLYINGYVFRVGEVQSTYYRFWEYESKRLPYLTLTENNAKSLREVVNVAFEKMSEKIADDLFVSTSTEVNNRRKAIEQGFVRATYSSR